MTRLDYEMFLRQNLPVPFKDDEGNDIVTLKDLDILIQKELSFYDGELEERIYFEFFLDKEQNVFIRFWYKDVKLHSFYDCFIYRKVSIDDMFFIHHKIFTLLKIGLITDCLRIQEEQAEQEAKEIQETKQAINRSNGWEY